jgi:alkylhydroperoxidase family enzyme
MVTYPIHTLDTAPAASKPALDGLQAAFGFIPNIAGAMATSPVLISSLAAVFQNVHAGAFSESQIQTLLLTNAVTNGSDWPVAFHTYLALQQGVPAADVEAIRTGRLPADPKSAALSRLARTLIETRGRIRDEDADAFLSAGFDEAKLLEVIAVVAASTITNYTASVARPRVEPPFDKYVEG